MILIGMNIGHAMDVVVSLKMANAPWWTSDDDVDYLKFGGDFFVVRAREYGLSVVWSSLSLNLLSRRPRPAPIERLSQPSLNAGRCSPV